MLSNILFRDNGVGGAVIKLEKIFLYQDGEKRCFMSGATLDRKVANFALEKIIWVILNFYLVFLVPSEVL